MKVAICDDNIKILGHLETAIETCFELEHEPLECDVFLSAKELAKKLDANDTYAMYFLDIEMPDMNGFEIAKAIREKDKKAVIIFVTSHKECMEEAFDVLAFHYLLKPLDPNKVKRVIRQAIQHVTTNKCLFYFQFAKKKYCLACEDILYFESHKRLIKIHTLQGGYEYYGTIEDLRKRTSPALFVQTHGSFIINLDYVSLLEKNFVNLKDGSKIPISKKYVKSFNQHYRNFILIRV